MPKNTNTHTAYSATALIIILAILRNGRVS